MKRRALIFGVGHLFLAAQADLPAGPAQSSEVRSLECQSGDTLILENDYGRVRIMVWDRPEIEVRIRRIAEDDDRLENIYLVTQRSGNKCFLRSYFYDYLSESVWLDVRTPPHSHLIVWGVNSAVEIAGAGLTGSVRVHTITGSITATDLSSSSSLVTEEGNIRYASTRQPAGDLWLETVRGTITCRIGEDLNLRSWLRAGGTLSWNDDLLLSSGTLEKQLGTGGPLLVASSTAGNVFFRLQREEDFSSSRVSRTARVERTEEWADTPVENDRTRQSAPFSQQGLREQVSGTVRGPAATEQEPAPVTYAGMDRQDIFGPDGYSLKVVVDWVYVNVSVRDRYTNRAVPHLLKEDFTIYEDGRIQTIQKFESTDAPFHLLLLVDVSGSTQSYIKMMKEASTRFTQQIKASDRIAVAAFNSRTRLMHNFSNDRKAVSEAIGSIRSGGGTAFYDALNRSLNEYMDGIEGRKAIVVFTDGVDNQLTGDYGSGSRITFNELYRGIQEADTLIYTIFLDTESAVGTRGYRPVAGIGGILGDIIFGKPGMSVPGGASDQEQTYRQAKKELQLIAEQTGGRAYAPGNIGDLHSVYSEIADDLRIQYRLGYQSRNTARDGRWRDIKVQVRERPEAAVRARKGYYGSED